MGEVLVQINWILNCAISSSLWAQLFLMYLLWLLVNSRNIFYTVVYMFLLLIYLGVFIAFYQMELYTGFLWVAEFSIVLVFLILVIYLNTDGYSKHLQSYSTSRFAIFVFISLCIGVAFHTNRLSLSYDFLMDEAALWDNYYEALFNTTTNDFNGLFLSYYNFNSFEFLLFALLLLFGTFLCVALFKSFYTVKTIPYSRFFSMFDFFALKTNYNFLRQQNLHTQTSNPAANRVIRKK